MIVFISLFLHLYLMGGILDEFPLFSGPLNSNQGTGGKSFGPFGRILGGIPSKIIHEDLLLASSKLSKLSTPWRYVVALNSKRGGRDINDIISNLIETLPAEERYRLALIFNYNEKVTIDNPLGYEPTWEEILPNTDQLAQYNIPILLMYTQWTAWRSLRGLNVGSQAVRKSIFEYIDALQNDRQKESAKNELRLNDPEHSYPFGQMRTHLLNAPASLKFISDLHSSSTGVYIHIQDSDFINLQEKPIFLMPSSIVTKDHLFKRYDQFLLSHKNSVGVLPVIAGGAHVYSLEEDISDHLNVLQKKPSLRAIKKNIDASKAWTRFISELGNAVKNIISAYQPYGLYFHEPNSLIMSPESLEIFKIKLPGYSKIKFGINSEMQEFTRDLFKSLSDENIRKLMAFSAYTILSTSTKSSNKTFAIRYSGDFDLATKKFSGWTQDDFMAVRGMHQEILAGPEWRDSMCTSFANHLVKDARAKISELFNLFDPYTLTLTQETQGAYQINFNNVIRSYQDLLSTEKIRDLFSQLDALYDKQKQGQLVSFYILSAALETGQMMRMMYHDHLASSVRIMGKDSIKTQLVSRLDYAREHGHPAPNAQVLTLLGLDKVPYRIKNEAIVQEIVKAVYAVHKDINKTAEALKTSPKSVKKILKNAGAPFVTQNLREEFNKGDTFGLDLLTLNEIKQKLF